MTEVNYEKCRIYTMTKGTKQYVRLEGNNIILVDYIVPATIFPKEGILNYKYVNTYLNNNFGNIIFALEEYKR